MADLSIAKMYMNRRPEHKSWDEAYTDTNKLAGQQRISDIMQNGDLTADQKRSASREALASYDPTAAMNMDYRDARDSKKDELTRQLQLAKDLKTRDPMAARAKLLSILDNYLDMQSTAMEKGWPTEELDAQIGRIKTQIQSDTTSIQKAFTPEGTTKTPEGGDSMYDFEVSYGGEDAPEAKAEPAPLEPAATDTYTPEIAMKQIRATKSLKELSAVRDHMVTTAKTWSKEQVKRVSDIVNEQAKKLTPKSRPKTTDAAVKKAMQAALTNLALFSLASELSTSAPADKYTLFKVKSRVFTPENVTDGDAAASKSSIDKLKAIFSKGSAESVSDQQAAEAKASIKSTYGRSLNQLKELMSDKYMSGVSGLHVQMMKDAIKNSPWREAKSSGKPTAKPKTQYKLFGEFYPVAQIKSIVADSQKALQGGTPEEAAEAKEILSQLNEQGYK